MRSVARSGVASAFLPLALVGALVLFGFWPHLPFVRRGAPKKTVVCYGFSILAEPLQQLIFPEFARIWREKSGEKIEFISAFAGSGTVTNQLVMGVPAAVAVLSLEPDAERLADAGVLARGSWRSLPHHGVVNRTPFVILVRHGNPKGIRGFEDLARPGVSVVHPDPLTSGGANWAILAEYGSGLRAGGPDEGRRRLHGIWRNVVAQASSARGARTQFENGFGDALVTYEQEALSDQKRGRLAGDVVYPRSTILSEHLVVVVERNVAPADRALVSAFVEFLWSPTAQAMFVAAGFRSVDPSLEANGGFAAIEDAFLVEDLGGWARAKQQIIEDVWKREVLPELGR